MKDELLEKDTLWSKTTIAAIGILSVSLLTIAFNSAMILCGLALLPNIIKSIRK